MNADNTSLKWQKDSSFRARSSKRVGELVIVKIVLNAQTIKGYESRITPGMSVEVEVTTK